jgi:acyl-CoA reductase-like NAD-dependent aldehyde dehydrogenase
MNIINPATEELLEIIPDSTDEQINEAVSKAQRAQRVWYGLSPSQRANEMRCLATTIEDYSGELAEIECRNTGKPIADAIGEIKSAVQVVLFYTGLVEAFRGFNVPVADGLDVTFNEPLGVIAAITPFNFPFLISIWKLAPAICCGNAVILKPAELTPLSVLRLKELIKDHQYLNDLIQVLPGKGETVGRALSTHEGISKISFTGSTEVGKQLASTCGSSLKRLSLELGGKSAMVVYSDCDLVKAAESAPFAVFANAGQDCCARSRILVEEPVLDKFISLFINATQGIRIGDPENPDTQIGPLIDEAQRKKVRGFFDPLPPNTEMIYSGPDEHQKGFFLSPKILFTTELQAPICQDEIFGPVCVVIPFNGEEQAVEIANNTSYGLSGSIWTKDLGKAIRTARCIQSGTISVNSNTSVRYSTPFGGMKQSGLGRELGTEALLNYSEVKNVYFSSGC